MGGLTATASVFRTDKIEVQGSDGASVEVPLRGLCFEDIVKLVRTHDKTAAELFNRMTSGNEGDIALEDATVIASLISQDGPAVMAEIIALAADEPTAEGVAAARVLPFTAQVEALEKIIVLTLEREGGLKNVVAAVTRIVAAVSKTMAELKGV